MQRIKALFMKKIIYQNAEEKKAAFMKAVKLRQLWEKAVILFVRLLMNYLQNWKNYNLKYKMMIIINIPK